MKLPFTLALICSFFILSAQNHPSCDGIRYRTDVFTEVETTTALKFSEGNTISGNFQELFLDVYEPMDDTASMRPVIILAFGGSFISGERGDVAFLCEAYAKKGYVAVAIDYRLYDLPLFPLPTANEMRDVVAKAVIDVQASVRYMRADAATDNAFRIDPNLVFTGGISAGAIAAAHAAVFDSTDVFEEELQVILDSNMVFNQTMGFNGEYSSEVQGFVSFSGALNDASWIDASDPPFVSVHDDMDGTVPYGEGFGNVFGVDIIYLEGSSILHTQADSLGITNDLMTIENSMGHVSYFFNNPQATEDAINFSADFLYDIICPEFISNVSDFPDGLVTIDVYPQPNNGVLNLRNENNLDLRLQLFNALGQGVGYWEQTNQLNLSSLENGIYFLQMTDQNTQETLVQKIILEQ